MNRTSSFFTSLLALLVGSCLSATASAALIITAGVWFINPAAGQGTDAITATPIAVGASGGELEEIELFMTSGPDGLTPGSAPLFESVDLISPGTVFHANNDGQTDFLPFPSLNTGEITATVSGFVTAEGVLAFLSFDATGIPLGTYQLLLTNLPFEVSTQTGSPGAIQPTLIDGTVTVIPEPGSIVLALPAACALVGFAAFGRRRRVTGDTESAGVR